MHVVAFAVGPIAATVALVRWLRVSQREHYIAGSCLVVARRWATSRGVNAAIAAVAVVAGVVALVFDAAVEAIVAAIAAAAYPVPLSASRAQFGLRWTRRATTLAAVVVVLAVIVALLAWLLGAAFAGAAVAAVLMVGLVDLGAAITAPFERRSMHRHRDRAAAKLRRIRPKVIAVTGSWGKTSTKNHIADLLRGSAAVVASPASFNNTGGLARTVNDHMPDTCDVLVAEMGMYGPGEIRALCAWIPPDIAVICAIGPMHLERVGSIEGIVAAKAEIMEPAEQVVLWVDNPYLAELASSCTGKRVWRVGTASSTDLDVEVRTADDRLEVRTAERVLGSCPIANGVHPENVGCAVAAALAFGIDERLLASRIATLESPEHRATTGQSERGVWVVDDTFNSNPAGASRALDTLVRGTPNGRRVVVTPGMVELGREQFELNRRFAAESVAADATLVVVGRTNRRALLAGAGGATTICVADRSAAVTWVRETLGEGDGVLWENDLPDHYP